MTQDFKENLFEWFIGTYTTESPKAFDTFKDKFNNTFQLFYAEMGTDTEITNAVQITSPNGNNSTWLVLLLWNGTTGKGGFLILDENLEQKALITQYTSGVDIGRYSNLYVDESGRIYSIECRPDEERYRFVMLSNFLVEIGNEYKCDIRKAYNLPNAWNTTFSSSQGIDNMTFIKKIPNEPKYAYYIFNFGANRGGLGTIEISVEEGTTIKESIVPPFSTGSFRPYITYDNDNLFEFDIILINRETSVNSTMIWTMTELAEYDGSRWFEDNFVAPTLDSSIILADSPDVFYIDKNTILIATKNSGNDKVIFKKIYFYDTGETVAGDPVWAGTVTDIYEEEAYSNKMQTKFYEVSGELFCYNYSQYNTTGIKEVLFHILNKTATITDNDFKEYIIQDETTVLYSYEPRDFFIVQNAYNLYNYFVGHSYITGMNKIYDITQVQEVYNENNYNGEEYKALNSLIGNSAILKGLNDLILFARNLYNKTIQDNKTTYSVEIPSNMLNEIQIKVESLLSETNNVMNNEHTEIIKNRFEEAIINFINHITIVNQNDEDNPVYFRDGASRLNKSVSNDKDYNNAKLTKYRINYIDNTSVVGNLQITSQGTSANLIISFKVKPTTQVKNIEFISNDELTVYNSITPNLEVNKSYRITQAVHIE